MRDPRGELRPHVVGRTDQSGFGKGATKEGQLAETDGPDLSFHPSAGLAESCNGERHTRPGPIPVARAAGYEIGIWKRIDMSVEYASIALDDSVA